MKKFKFLACALLFFCSGLIVAGCKETTVDFDTTKIAVENLTVTYNGEEQIFSVGYPDEEITVTYAKDKAENFVAADELDLTDAGTYTIYYKISAEGFNDYISEAQTFKIEQKAITINLPTITDLIANAKTTQQLINEVMGICNQDSELIAGDSLGLTVVITNYDKAEASAGDSFVIAASDNDANYAVTVVNGAYNLVDVASVTSSGTTVYYGSLESAMEEVQDGDTIKLYADVTVEDEIVFANSVVLDGQGLYTIKASEDFTDRRVIALETAEKTLELKNVTIDANCKARGVYVNAGTLKINGATITKGKVSDSFIGGVYITNSASFEMTSGNITGNHVGDAYATDGYKQYTADLWIGANAEGELNAEISGGVIGNVFVNANSYSANDKGDFTITGGTIENVYVEYDDGYGAEFVYTDGVVNNLYVSTLQTEEAVKVTPVAGTTYEGGVVATATVAGVDTVFNQKDVEPSGAIYTFLEAHPDAYVKVYVDGEFLPFVLTFEEVDEIVLVRDITLSSTLTISRTVILNGQNKFTIKASDSFAEADRKLIALETEGKVLTLKDITLDGNLKTRVVYVSAGTLVVDGATITKGKVNDSFIGGVYITNSASFVMTSGNITGNQVGQDYETDGYTQYSADLWIGANAEGELNAEISGGVIGNVFVNANSYSANDKGDFTITGGTIENVYVEYDDGYGAEFVYTDGVVNNLYVSTTTTGESVKVTPVKGTTYIGGTTN